MLRFLHGKLAQDNLPKRIIWLLRGLYSCMVLRVNDGGLLKKTQKFRMLIFKTRDLHLEEWRRSIFLTAFCGSFVPKKAIFAVLEIDNRVN